MESIYRFAKLLFNRFSAISSTTEPAIPAAAVSQP
jgi:hypothetical protein